jgi:integrase/recombinase XerD
MKPTSLLVRLRSRCFPRWRAVPIFGPLLDDFVRWMHADQNYTLQSASIYLNGVPKIVRWLRARQVRSLSQLTLQHLKAAHRYFRPRHQATSGAVRTLERFLRSEGTVAEGQVPVPTPAEVEVDAFSNHLREARGLAEKTIHSHRFQVRAFLKFLQFNRRPAHLQHLQPRHIEAFLCQVARTNNRFSLQHVVATVRAFLQWRHARGLLSRPLHLQIDTPRVYRGERLPQALPRDQVQALLQSIDRSDPLGNRDFTIVYLAAAYGLRSGEVIRLSLDDLDWQRRTLRIRQTKTRQTLQMPLTDEAANVLIRYLRQARPQTAHRELFLRTLAPRSPMRATAVREILARRIRRSGLEIPPCGTNVLRHSFAMRLLQRGVALKTIGDSLGHRDIESTSVYIRLDVDALREVALPVPTTVPSDPVTLVAVSSLPRIRPARPSRHLPAAFHSGLASSLQRYVDLQRALGRCYLSEAAVLRHWDDFLQREYPGARRMHGEMFRRWTRRLAHLTPTGSHTYQRIVRKFLVFHARDHTGTFIPDRLTFPKPLPVKPPRLISEVEMGRVLGLARQLPPTPANPLRAETIRLGLILLFCGGLRCGELLHLKLSDVEGEEAVLRIRMTKFYKSRLVPLSPSVTAELQKYLQQRRRKRLPMAPTAFLMWSGHRGSEVYSATNLGIVWHQLCFSAGVLTAQGHPPRLHDLRHSAAVNALQRWYAQGADVQAKLPLLATYLGHANAASAHYYLKLTPELREAASQRFHQHFGALFTVGGLS